MGKSLAEMFEILTDKQKMISLGNDMINRIIKRTQSGQDVFETKFKPYSTKNEYKKNNKVYKYTPYWINKQKGKFKRQAIQFKPGSNKDVNLTLTGDMLNSFKVKKATNTRVRIGFTPSESKKVIGNEKNGRIISSTTKVVSDSDEKFITKFYDQLVIKAMNKVSDTTEITIG